MEDGCYCLTTVANDVPVTYLTAAMILGKFRVIIGENSFLRNSLQMEFKANELSMSRFIGEEIILLTILGEMFDNSIGSGSSTFQIEVTETSDRIILSISDDGCGVTGSVQGKMLDCTVTNKSNGFGADLFLSRLMIRKIGGDLVYKGKGIDGRGACFEMSFLKEMPN